MINKLDQASNLEFDSGFMSLSCLCFNWLSVFRLLARHFIFLAQNIVLKQKASLSSMTPLNTVHPVHKGADACDYLA